MAIALTSCVISAPALSCPSASNSTVVAGSKKPAGTIVDIAGANPELSTLVKAVQAAGLVETLSGETLLTVFAPTNEAFAALPEGTLERLLQPENREALRKVLTYHVVPGALESKNLRSGRVKTVEGSLANLSATKDGVRVNDANVIVADVKASNGVVHVIDRVILPPNFN